MDKNNRGFSLLEVLLSFFILALGISGLLMLQLSSTRLENQSRLYNIATQYAYSVSDLLYLGLDSQVQNLQENIQNDLPKGSLAVTEQANTQSIKISWELDNKEQEIVSFIPLSNVAKSHKNQ
jgi:Tfp pilus assembly protein PilV